MRGCGCGRSRGKQRRLHHIKALLMTHLALEVCKDTVAPFTTNVVDGGLEAGIIACCNMRGEEVGDVKREALSSEHPSTRI